MTLPYTLTLIADRTRTSLSATLIETAREMVKGHAPTILSEAEAVDIPCGAPKAGSPGIATIRAVFNPRGIDVVQSRTRGRRKGLLVADMDSTIVQGETLDDLAAYAGIGEKIAEITRRSMNGEIAFEEALRERVALLRGKPTSLLERAMDDIRLTDGAIELVRTMRVNNAVTALVSGGFTYFTSRVAELCGFSEHHANVLGIDGDSFDGDLAAPILGPEAKLEHLRRMADARGLRMSATMAVGDGANDIPMLENAGLGIGFHAKPIVKQSVDNLINCTSLRSLLFAQGYSQKQFWTP